MLSDADNEDLEINKLIKTNMKTLRAFNTI